MRILIIYPEVSGLKNGNVVTVERWQQILVELGHTVEIATAFHSDCVVPNLMIALHAVKSSRSIENCRAAFAAVPIIVVLTGTDIYDVQFRAVVDGMLDLADRIVVLQNATAEDVDPKHRDKVRVIYQAIAPMNGVYEKSGDHFEVCVVGHLRQVKDPFQIACATNDLPLKSKIRVTQIGAALSDEMRATAEHYANVNARYRWIGEITREAARERIARSHLLVNSSIIEGGAAVICEAIVAATPILATRIAGNVGFLGEDYDGLFEVGATEQLRNMLLSAESRPEFYQRLKDQCESRKVLFDPRFERLQWAELVKAFDR